MKIDGKITVLILLLASFYIGGCTQQKEKEVDNTIEGKTNEKPILLEKLNNSPAYNDAVLKLNSPNLDEIQESKKVNFEFEVSNYNLGAQTESTNTTLLANSGKGQHIHFILNNQPYSAHYEPLFTKEIPNGEHHLVAFLSRSYHESVKNENSVVVKKIKVGETVEGENKVDIDAPTLIYSRPKGTYSGNDTKNLLLDFFVLNTTLSENGNKVKAVINETEFIITEWSPYVIKNLPLGEVNIELSLINKEGNLIQGPFNKVKRTIELKE